MQYYEPPIQFCNTMSLLYNSAILCASYIILQYYALPFNTIMQYYEPPIQFCNTMSLLYNSAILCASYIILQYYALPFNTIMQYHEPPTQFCNTMSLLYNYFMLCTSFSLMRSHFVVFSNIFCLFFTVRHYKSDSLYISTQEVPSDLKNSSVTYTCNQEQAHWAS